MDVEGKVGLMEEEALKRKERLKSRKRKLDSTDNAVEKASFELTVPKPKFRSYKPQDDTLKESVIPDAKPSDVIEEVKDQLEAGKTKVVIDELDITNLAPRKPDWDLKRDVAKKLEKIERRTQKAIAELIRDRLKAGQENLGAIVNMVNEVPVTNDDEE